MSTNRLNSDLGRSKFPNMSALGILFFMLGAPNLYAFFLNRRTEGDLRQGDMSRYTWLALVAMAIAGIMELSFF